MKRLLVFCLLLSAVFAAAQDNSGASKTSFSLTASSLPEAKIAVSQSWTLPVLRGSSFLTSANNIRFSLTGDLSPISVNGVAEAVLTPVAFAEISAGTRIGSGWNINLLGFNLHGIGLNKSAGGHKARTDGSAFDGISWGAQAGGALQFDLGAVIPGAWSHVLFRVYQEINYKMYSRAAAGESWYFENDYGENQNGFCWKGSYVIGYQMPLLLNTVAIMADRIQRLYNTPGNTWGDDLGYWELSLALNFSLTKKMNLTLIAQMRTMRNYTAQTAQYEWYRDRVLASGADRRLEFYRIAAIYSVSL